MAWTQDDINALKASIATGIKDVQYSDGSRVTYRSLEEMKDILGQMQGEVEAGAVKRVRTIRVNSCKGF